MATDARTHPDAVSLVEQCDCINLHDAFGVCDGETAERWDVDGVPIALCDRHATLIRASADAVLSALRELGEPEEGMVA